MHEVLIRFRGTWSHLGGLAVPKSCCAAKLLELYFELKQRSQIISRYQIFQTEMKNGKKCTKHLEYLLLTGLCSHKEHI